MQGTTSASGLRSAPPTFSATPKKEGILKKKGVGVAGVWQKRWHAIDSGFVGWWKDVKKPDNMPPRGWVNLENCSLFVFANTTQLALQASKNDMPKTYHWKAASEEERDAWASAMIAAGAYLRTPSSLLSSSAPEPIPPLPKSDNTKPMPLPKKKFATLSQAQSTLNKLSFRPEPITGLKPFLPPSLRHQLFPSATNEGETEVASSPPPPSSYTESDTTSSSSGELFPSVPTHNHTPVPVPSTYTPSPIKGGSLIEQHKKSNKPLPQPGSTSLGMPTDMPHPPSPSHKGSLSLYDFPSVPSSPEALPPVPHNKKPLLQPKPQLQPQPDPQLHLQPQPQPKPQPLPQLRPQPQPQQQQVKAKPKPQMRSVSVFSAVPVPVEYFETPAPQSPSSPSENGSQETGELKPPYTTTTTKTTETTETNSTSSPREEQRLQAPQRPERPARRLASEGEKAQRRRSKSVSSLSEPQKPKEPSSSPQPKSQKRPYPKVLSYMTVQMAVVEPVEAVPFDEKMNTFAATTPKERPSIAQYPWEH